MVHGHLVRSNQKQSEALRWRSRTCREDVKLAARGEAEAAGTTSVDGRGLPHKGSTSGGKALQGATRRVQPCARLQPCAKL